MFNYQEIESLNRLELTVYDYIIQNKSAVMGMTIRDLANKSHVSTTTVLRFCNKVGLDGFMELKYVIKRDLAHQKLEQPKMTRVVDSVNEFLSRFNDQTYQDHVQQVAEMMVDADLILFFGIGTSGTFAQYGARLLANLGLYTLSIVDPFQPQPAKLRHAENVVLVDVSVSGEREQVLKQAQFYHELGAKVVSITNTAISTLARLSDVNIAYNAHEVRDVVNDDVDLTTQVPVVLTMEQIMHKTHKLQAARRANAEQ
ncbi:MurR/RpiR family transcriptional regulator [Lactiplantibacillus sp. WILCCON 0030]|uniref:MurR/RpiR family transcriptional regulator n=1 Tax=Lactiplantibacillus brownii TaxID=3069269 RepID=A0ABU1ACA0_9LACO|nr:MurR/RpiR family transcriptional regulator [Lactiplantibacillus brownii]MDQ7938545.1 MurR/RpiR family transcriptional regulator [Lactiplantibacillus brownii]